MGVMARIPGYSATSGKQTQLASGLGPHWQRVGCHAARMVRRPRCTLGRQLRPKTLGHDWSITAAYGWEATHLIAGATLPLSN
jgi:hypothetical protein